MTSRGESWPPEFLAFLKMQEQKDQMKDDAVITFLKSRTLPTPDHVQTDINRSVGRRPQLLRYHAYWEEHRLKSGLDSLFVLHIKRTSIFVAMMPLLALSQTQRTLNVTLIKQSATLSKKT